MKTIEHRRVVITGIGAVSAAGYGAEPLWEKARDGICAITELTLPEAVELGIKFGGQIPDYDPEEHFDRRKVRRSEHFVQFALMAAAEACEDAGVEEWGIAPERFGVSFSSGIGGLTTIQEEARVMFDRGPRRVNPLFIPMMISSSAAGEVALQHGAKGVCQGYTTACASGTSSLGEAYWMIAIGRQDAAIVGGTEEAVIGLGIAGFANLGALTKAENVEEASIPFDERRTGFVIGQGAGAVVLEELESALARGAHIYAEISGYGAGNDAHHITAPDPSAAGLIESMRVAIEAAGLTPDDIDHMNAHGTSTGLNDLIESKALRTVLGEERGTTIPVTSTKAVVGHTFAAAGVLEAICTARALEEQVFPATANHRIMDPECGVTVLHEPRAARPGEFEAAISTSVGFGGFNTAIVLERWADQ